jgi:hypothetical protein
MKKRLVWAILALVLLSPATASTIADYPAMFFEKGEFTATIVKSETRDSAERIANNLLISDLQRESRHRPLRMMPGRDEMIIGTPCGNLRVRELLNIPAGKCQTYFRKEQGLLKLIEDEHQHLIITGSDSERVLDAVKVLTDPRQRHMLRVTNAPIERRYYRKHYVVDGRQVLDIGQTIGAVTPALYTGYSHVTYEPYHPQDCVEYTATTYGAVIARTRPGCPQYYGGVPTRDINVLGMRTALRFPDGKVVLEE